jgi:hypothetical protein
MNPGTQSSHTTSPHRTFSRCAAGSPPKLEPWGSRGCEKQRRGFLVIVSTYRFEGHMSMVTVRPRLRPRSPPPGVTVRRIVRRGRKARTPIIYWKAIYFSLLYLVRNGSTANDTVELTGHTCVSPPPVVRSGRACLSPNIAAPSLFFTSSHLTQQTLLLPPSVRPWQPWQRVRQSWLRASSLKDTPSGSGPSPARRRGRADLRTSGWCLLPRTAMCAYGMARVRGSCTTKAGSYAPRCFKTLRAGGSLRARVQTGS